MNAGGEAPVSPARAVEKWRLRAHSSPKGIQRNRCFGGPGETRTWTDRHRPIPDPSGNVPLVRSEDDYDLEVAGEFPLLALRGAFYRNGPNPQFEPRGHYHWFTGDGMIHAFFVDGGKVAYRNRYVRTPKWQLEHAAGKALFGGFDPRAADPSVTGKDSGVANTNIVWHAGRLMALEEAHKPFEIDSDKPRIARLC